MNSTPSEDPSDQDPHAADPGTLLSRWVTGDDRAGHQLSPIVYDELRRIASHQLQRERIDHTLQPTALVHEAWAKLIRQERSTPKDQAHFRALASQAMRRILVDHARRKRSDKRDHGGVERVTLAGVPEAQEEEMDVLGLNAALDRLAQLHGRQAKVVEMRFFGGLTVEETALALDVSERTVKGDWAIARAWLQRELQGS